MKLKLLFIILILTGLFSFLAIAADVSREQTQYLLIVNLYEQDAFDLAQEQIRKFNNDFPSSSLGDRLAFIEVRIDQEKGALDLAGQKYKTFIKKFPRSKMIDQALFYLGEVSYRSGDHQDALLSFQRLQLDFPKSSLTSKALFWSAEVYFALKDLNRARLVYEQFISSYPDDAYQENAWYSLGYTNLQLKNLSQAVSNFNYFLTHYPRSSLRIPVIFFKGISSFQSGQYAEARKSFEAIIEEQPVGVFWSRSLYYLAECAYRLGDYAQAESFYQETLEAKIEPAFQEKALYGLAWTFFVQEKYPAALETFNKLTSRFTNSPLNSSALLEQGVILEKQQKFAEAEKIYTRIQKQPNVAAELLESAEFGLVKTLYQQQNYIEALKHGTDYSSAYPYGKYKDIVNFFTGESHSKLGQFDKAIPFYQKILRDDPKSIYSQEAWYKLGVALARTDNRAPAIQAFKTLAEKYPNTAYLNEALFTLAELNYQDSKFAEARDNYQQLLLKNNIPQSIEEKAWYGAAWTAFKLGDYSKALELFTVVQTRYPNNAYQKIVALKKAESLSNLKQYEKAIAEFNGFTEKYPSSSMVLDAYLQIGLANYKFNRFGPAIQSFAKLGNLITSENIQEKQEVFLRSIYWTGWSYFRQAEYQKAYLSFEKLIAVAPPSFVDLIKEANLRQGDCLFNLQRFNDALAKYDKAAKMPGDNYKKDALSGSFYSQLELGNYTEAKTVWKKLSALYPDDPMLMEMDEKLIDKQNH
ncbi:MAG: tetratricopeptide repeat protein [Candidatus Margulisiibacteriota bacterium]|jgi:TolA-binding protein